MLVDALRRVSAAERFVRRRLWLLQDGGYPLASKLGGKRVGIIGLGNIGLLIAKRLEAFGGVVYYNSRRPKDSVSYKYFSNVHHLASESDILVVACALNKETRHIVNKDVLEALGKDGIVINIGRGANIDEAALVGALRGEDCKCWPRSRPVRLSLSSKSANHSAVFFSHSKSANSTFNHDLRMNPKVPVGLLSMGADASFSSLHDGVEVGPV